MYSGPWLSMMSMFWKTASAVPSYHWFSRDALGGGQDVEALVALGPQEVPALLQMADQGMGLVLGGDADAANARIDRIGKGEIDDAGLAAEIDRRFGAALGQLGQTACRGRLPGHRPSRHAPGAVRAGQPSDPP